MKEILKKALNNLKLKLEIDIQSVIDGDIDLDMGKLFNDFEEYFKYKDRLDKML